jgi:hypothetical protein
LTTNLRKKKTKKVRRKPQDQESGSDNAGMSTAALAGLQQRLGNRAVQQMLAAEKQAQAERLLIIKTAMQHQKVEEEEEAETGEPVEVLDEQAVHSFSGPEWVHQFPVSDKVADLDTAFGTDVAQFIAALEKAGARVDILATAWPPERAYLMHWAWQIANEKIDPRQVPHIKDIDFGTDVSVDLDILWWHGDLDDSQAAAEQMIDAFGIADLEQPPPLDSLHVAGEAIDMEISWGGETLVLEDPGGEEVVIAEGPQDGTHPGLIALGLVYGVIHYGDTDEDAVHWSVDGS